MKDTRQLSAFAYTILSLLGIFMIFPFLWMFFSSFKGAEEIFRHNFFPDRIGPDNYIAILTSRHARFTTWFRNSILIAVVTTCSVLFFDSLLG